MDTSLHESIKMVGNEQLDAIVDDVIGSMRAHDRTHNQQQKYAYQTHKKLEKYGENLHQSQRAEMVAVYQYQWTFKELFSIILSQSVFGGQHGVFFRLASWVQNSDFQNGADDMLGTRLIFDADGNFSKCMEVTDALYIVWLGNLVRNKALYRKMSVNHAYNQIMEEADVEALVRYLQHSFQLMISRLKLEVSLEFTGMPWLHMGHFTQAVMYTNGNFAQKEHADRNRIYILTLDGEYGEIQQSGIAQKFAGKCREMYPHLFTGHAHAEQAAPEAADDNESDAAGSENVDNTADEAFSDAQQAAPEAADDEGGQGQGRGGGDQGQGRGGGGQGGSRKKNNGSRKKAPKDKAGGPVRGGGRGGGGGDGSREEARKDHAGSGGGGQRGGGPDRDAGRGSRKKKPKDPYKEFKKKVENSGFKGRSGRGGGPPPGGKNDATKNEKTFPPLGDKTDDQRAAEDADRQSHAAQSAAQADAQTDKNKTTEQKDADKEREENVKEETESRKEKESPGRYKQWREQNNKGPIPPQPTKENRTEEKETLDEYNAWWDEQWKKFKTGKSPLPGIRHKTRGK